MVQEFDEAENKEEDDEPPSDEWPERITDDDHH